MCRHLEILSVRSANLPAGEGVAFLGRNGSDYNVGIEDVGFSVTVILVVNLVGYGVAVDSESALDDNILCGHREILSVRSANLPAGEGAAFLGRNGSDCNVGIEDVGFSVTVILVVNLVDYSVLVDSERTVKENVLCRHGELAISNLDNVCNVSCRSPTVEGVAGLGRLIKQSNFLAIYVRRNLFFIVDFVNTAVNKVAYGELVRNPLCVQMQVGHQKLVRTDCLFCAIGAVCIGVPAAESVAVRNGKHILENDMGIARDSGFNMVACAHAGDSAIVRVISYSNRNTGNVAVNMDIQLAVLRALILDGVPYDADVVYVEVVAQNRGIGRRIIVGVASPVLRVEETEVGRNVQIFGRNAVYDIGNRIAFLRNCVRAFLGERADIAGALVKAAYAAVGPAARQVEFFALIIVVLRGAAIRQKYEILSRGRGRFRRSRGAGSPPRSERQVFARHQVAGLVLFARCFIIPADKGVVFALSVRNGDSHVGINFADSVGVVIARDDAAVQNVFQLVRLNFRGDVNLNGSVEAIGLGKVNAELILAVFVFGRVAEIERVERYTVNGVMVGVSLTNQNRRNGKGLAVPELPVVGERVGTVSVLDVNLIGYAAVLRIVSVRVIYFIRKIIICPVGNVDLNHLGVIGANQIVEYQLVAAAESFPTVVFLIMVFEMLQVFAMIADSIDFSTEGAAVSAVLYLTLPIAEYTGMAENGGFVAVDVGTGWGCQFSNGNAVLLRDTGPVRTDSQRVDTVSIGCGSVGNPILSCKRLGRRDVHREVETVDKAVGLICRVLRLVVYVGSAVCCTVVLRIVFRSVGRSVVIARLRAVRTAVCFVVRRSRCGILILGRLCLGFRRSGNSGSFGGVCFNGSGLCYGTVCVHERQRCDAVIVGQRPARAHGQHHDSRKSSCEQAFARILF